jgi:SAM-dependent methyltransferase
VTTFLSTDIASVPLLWIIPLIIYLLTFVLVFARKPLIPHRIMVFLEPFVIIPLSVFFFIQVKTALWQALPFHLLAFFVIAMVCHGELMHSRPPAGYLTEFYLWISVGGVLGGIFNALLAPILFNSVIEYPLIIVVACLLRPSLSPADQKSPERRWDILLPLILAVFLALLFQVFQALPDHSKPLALLITACAAGIFCYRFRFRPWRLGLGLGVLILAGTWFIAQPERVLLKERNFFGISQVTEDAAGHYRILTHGSTIHGAQSLDPDRRHEPLTYYHPNGPLGQVFAVFSGPRAKQDVAVVGLGTGTIACYAQAGQHFTFYEIDPAMERIARDPRYFTYLSDCPAPVGVILGDARLSLKDAPDSCYGMIILDAFSSDAIPIHLVTREAIRLYLSKLKEGGILVFHISNRYLDLKSVLGSLAWDAGLVALSNFDLKESDEDRKHKKMPSAWVVMAWQRQHLGGLVQDQRWHTLPQMPGKPLWTDDFSNVWSVFNWSSFTLGNWLDSFTKSK